LPRPPTGLAKDYGASLSRAGFRKLSPAEKSMKGDVVIIDAVVGHPAGHMAMFDGVQWVSDFKQRDLLPGPAYRHGTAKFAIYRYPMMRGATGLW